MTHAGIECFLAVCRYKTGSCAAEALYITQSSLSTRLKTLENELGGPLFHRKKGCREMTLTTAGKAFYELAVQYEALVLQMQQVCKKQASVLRVSSFNSISTYLLPTVCDRFLAKHPDILLEIQDMEREAAVRSILNGTTDIAFTSGKVVDSLVIQTPVFSEPMVVVASKKNHYSQPVCIQQLPTSKQIYIKWSNAFDRWYHQNFDGPQPQISISIMAHLRRFVEQEDCWAIVPISVADGIADEVSICRLDVSFPLPKREIACLTAADSKDDAAIMAFFECLQKVITEHADLISEL